MEWAKKNVSLKRLPKTLSDLPPELLGTDHISRHLSLKDKIMLRRALAHRAHVDPKVPNYTISYPFDYPSIADETNLVQHIWKAMMDIPYIHSMGFTKGGSNFWATGGGSQAAIDKLYPPILPPKFFKTMIRQILLHHLGRDFASRIHFGNFGRDLTTYWFDFRVEDVEVISPKVGWTKIGRKWERINHDSSSDSDSGSDSGSDSSSED